MPVKYYYCANTSFLSVSFSADNRSKQRRQQRSLRAQDFTAFAERNENQRIHISPQLTLATFQFLSSSMCT